MAESGKSSDIVRLVDIRKTYITGELQVPVLKGINATVCRGEFVGFIGTSGSGKSTLLNILGMLDVPTGGQYYLEDIEVSQFSDVEQATIRSLKITNVIFLFGILAMIVGSVNAIREKHIKRMLAYSSVAQIGYIYLGVGLGIEAGVVAAVFQIIAHAFTKPLLFVSVGALSSTAGHEKKWYYLRGAGRRCKLAGIGFTLGGLSMVGIPLLAGFVTKLYLAQGATLAAWQTAAALAALAVSSVLNAMYYIPAIVQIWSSGSTCQEMGIEPRVRRADPALVVSVLVLGVGVILLGVCYRPVVGVISAGLALL